MLTVTAAIGTFVVVVVSTAQTDPHEKRLVDKVGRDIPGVLARYGQPAIIAEGHRICVYEELARTGRLDFYTGINDRIVADMPMSEIDAIRLEADAVSIMC
jgi:hypothetical protein